AHRPLLGTKLNVVLTVLANKTPPVKELIDDEESSSLYVPEDDEFDNGPPDARHHHPYKYYLKFAPALLTPLVFGLVLGYEMAAHKHVLISVVFLLTLFPTVHYLSKKVGKKRAEPKKTEWLLKFPHQAPPYHPFISRPIKGDDYEGEDIYLR